NDRWRKHLDKPIKRGFRSSWGVSFTDANTGTIVGGAGLILRTTDGGNNWIPQASGTESDLLRVSFTNTNNGTAVGQVGTILRTTDGGSHWGPQQSGTTELLAGVSFTDADHGIAVGALGTIVRTADGGNTWEMRRAEQAMIFREFP